MPNSVLVAALGDHPAVITCAVKAFYAAGVPLDEVRLLYPDEGDATNLQRIIGREGVEMIDEYLHAHFPACHLRRERLLFADASSVESSVAFLHCLRMALDGYADPEGTQVHLLLAGGRKNMAALMALAAQFYPNVVGLYHLLHRQEGQGGGVFQSLEHVEAAGALGAARVRDSLDQPLGDLNLFAVPYPGPFAHAATLREAVDRMNRGEPHDTLLRLPAAAALFYKAVLAREDQAPAAPGGLDVWLSADAQRQFQQWQQEQGELADQCLRHLPDMADAAHLRANSTTNPRLLFAVYKPVGATVRPLYVMQKDKVVVVALARGVGANEFEPRLEVINRQLQAAGGLQSLAADPSVRLAQLRPQQRALIVPLGKSPMVATQTYTLLSESEAEGRPQIPLVVLVYPQLDEAIAEDVALLQELFQKRGVRALPQAVPHCADLDSTEACEAFRDAIRDAIRAVRRDHAELRIDLSLSGGRKGMSALALFAAQAEDVGNVYHTIITDRVLERRVEKETSWKQLHGGAPRAAVPQRLFLEAYDRSKFVLFPIPVIPVAKDVTVAPC